MNTCTISNYERPTYNVLAEIFSKAILSGYITNQERQQLKETLLTDSLRQDDLLIANRLLYAIRRNILKLGV